MGILKKLFGRSSDDDGPVVLSPFDSEQVRPHVEDLVAALANLADAMDTEDAPLSNPGWRGRMRDLINARADLRLVLRKSSFTKDDLYEVLTTVRPIYRGVPPKEFTHLAELNDRVIDALEAVHEATA